MPTSPDHCDHCPACSVEYEARIDALVTNLGRLQHEQVELRLAQQAELQKLAQQLTRVQRARRTVRVPCSTCGGADR